MWGKSGLLPGRWNIIRVVLVDDSDIVRERLRAMLGEVAGIEIVGESRDSVEAIDSIRKLNPDAVVLDIRLPNGSGIDVLQRVKEDNPSTTVIMLTNYPYPQYRRKCLEAGADFFLDKSTEFDKLPEILRHLNEDSQT